MLTILPSSSTRAILLTSLAIYSCIPLKAIQYYIIISLHVQVPQLFVDGNYVGGEKEIELYHESGELKKILQKAGAVAY